MVHKIIAQMERDVAEARRAYQHAADRKRRDPQAAYDAWRIYARLLHALRLQKRNTKS